MDEALAIQPDKILCAREKIQQGYGMLTDISVSGMLFYHILTTVKSLLIISGSTGDTRQQQQNRAAKKH